MSKLTSMPEGNKAQTGVVAALLDYWQVYKEPKLFEQPENVIANAHGTFTDLVKSCAAHCCPLACKHLNSLNKGNDRLANPASMAALTQLCLVSP